MKLPGYEHGWFQLANISDIPVGISGANVGELHLAIVKTEDKVAVYPAYCPHRGAHLPTGGQLVGDQCIRCPFHHYQIGLDIESVDGFKLNRLPDLQISGLLFVRLSEQFENGLTSKLNDLLQDHVFIPGFSLDINASAELVIENGFDGKHFPAVHGISTEPFTIAEGAGGTLEVQSTFHVPNETWFITKQGDRTRPVTYEGLGFSPGVFLSVMGGAKPYAVLSTATPHAEGCTYRITLLLPRATYGDSPDPVFVQQLLAYSREGLEKDQEIWRNINADVVPGFTDEDECVLAFQRFCRDFHGPPGA